MVITRTMEIDYGHRLLKHEGKCSNLHGHRGKFDISVMGRLDPVGRIVDFSVIKDRMADLFDKWDHAFLVQEGDPLIAYLKILKSRHVVLKVPPTAEHLARLVFEYAEGVFPQSVVTRVVCWETPTCRAEYP